MIAANDNGLRFLSVCSGIEAASVAFGPLGWQAVAFSEIEKFPSAVLAHHYPDVPNLGDFTKIDTTKLGRVDILCGGTPCQSFSVAGLRKGLNDARGNLTLSFVELAHELATGNGLRNVIWENVVGVLSDKTGAFGCFLAGLVGADSAIEPPRRGKWGGAGMVSGPKGTAAWRVLDGQYFGIPQRRRRVIVVASFGNGADPAAVLFEQDGLRRHSPPSREAGEVTSGATKSGAGGGGARTIAANDVVGCMPHQAHGGVDTQPALTGYIQPVVGVHGSISHTLKAEGADASEDGTGRGTPIIAFTAKDYGADAQTDLSPTLRACGHATSHANAGVMPAVTVAIRGREGGATAELGGDVATALRASQGGGDKPHILTAIGADTYNGTVTGDVAATLGTRSGDGLSSGPSVLTSAVRRLTPKECERLQGFPDDYTAIPWRGKPADQCPDGPRYKALGNSWAVPKFAWLGRRIAALMPAAVANDNISRKEAA